MTVFFIKSHGDAGPAVANGRSLGAPHVSRDCRVPSLSGYHARSQGCDRARDPLSAIRIEDLLDLCPGIIEVGPGGAIGGPAGRCG